MVDLNVLLLWGFVGMAMCLYLVLGGADYGAGILELWPAKTLRGAQKQIINDALGPVWEANHMWLIIIVVILFIGFPSIFNIVMIALHVPMVALLMGIVLRGAVFSARHYDAVKSRASQNAYTVLFALSSIWTSLWIGIIAASLFRGRIDPNCVEPWGAYVAAWWGYFPLCVGLLVCVLFAFLASVFLIGETTDTTIRRFFIRRALILNGLVYVASALVFWAGSQEKNVFFKNFLTNTLTRLCIIMAICCMAFLWSGLARRHPTLMRLSAAGHNTSVLLGWYVLHAPHAVLLSSGPISFFQAAANQAIIRQLLIALCIGSLLIFPSLFALLRTFKRNDATDAL